MLQSLGRRLEARRQRDEMMLDVTDRRGYHD
jgi:hypothetical protein